MKNKNTLRQLVSKTLITFMGVMLFAHGASAAILFQSDDFHDINGNLLVLDADGAGASNTTITFGDDITASENGNIVWNITTNTFEFDHSIDITGGLTADGYVDFSGTTRLRIREDADPGTNAACVSQGELIMDTTDNELQICTGAGSPGTWTAIAGSGNADTLDSLDSLQFLRSDTSDGYTSGTLTFSAGTTLDVDGAADFGGATSFAVRSATSNPGTCAEGELIYNSTSNVLSYCSATDTWTSAAPQDLESIYATDGDGVLTTSNGNFGIAVGSGEFDVTSTGLIDFNAGSFDMDLTGTFAVNASGASNLTIDSGTLTLSTTTSGDVALTGADDVTITAGDDIIFNDLQLAAPINLTNTATGFAATLDGGGIIDNINQFTETTAGDGASNVGLETGSLTNVTPASDDVQAALEALDVVAGAGAPNNAIMSFYPEYPDTVIFQDGSNNKGKLESDYDDTNDEQFYRWTSTQGTTQDIDLRFRFSLPADFADVNDLTFKYRTGSVTEADNDVEIGIYNATNETTGDPTLCGTDTTNGTAGTWATGTIAEATIEAGCTGATALDAGDIIEIAVKLLDNGGAADYADIGLLILGYDN